MLSILSTTRIVSHLIASASALTRFQTSMSLYVLTYSLKDLKIIVRVQNQKNPFFKKKPIPLGFWVLMGFGLYWVHAALVSAAKVMCCIQCSLVWLCESPAGLRTIMQDRCIACSHFHGFLSHQMWFGHLNAELAFPIRVYFPVGAGSFCFDCTNELFELVCLCVCVCVSVCVLGM